MSSGTPNVAVTIPALADTNEFRCYDPSEAIKSLMNHTTRRRNSLVMNAKSKTNGRGVGVGTGSQDSRVVIVGAGCFGLSTAYHLSLRGYTNITILDRATTLPASDASSNDINRIIRSSYNDKFYAALALEAITAWKDRKFWGNTYHESGVLVLGIDSTSENNPVAQEGTSTSWVYADESFVNDLELGCSLLPLPDPASIRSALPSNVRTGSFEGDGLVYYRRTGYLNRDGGWADAGQGVRILLSEVKKLGVEILSGKSVSNIQWDNGKATGVSCADGTTYDADLVVIATGSWTPSAFRELDLGGQCLSTGQVIAMIQLTEDEAERYRNCPVVLDFLNGFYCFPPTDKNIIKAAIHGPGYLHIVDDAVSTPRTVFSHPDNGLAIPKDSITLLRKGLREIFPDLAEKPLSGTRLCWYNDTPDGNWMIGRYPSAENVIFATGGSGHAYKFLPVIGRLVADLIEDKMEPALVKKFAVNRVHARLDQSRSGLPIELDLSQLCLPPDFDLERESTCHS